MDIKGVLRGRFMNHPLHPVLVHLPVGLWVISLVFDIIYLAGGEPNLAVASFYCIAFGILGAALAAIPGIAEYLAIPRGTRAREIGLVHGSLNVIVTALFIVNYFWRRSMEHGVPFEVTAGQFILTIVSVILLGVSGYLGGVLVYGYGVGLRPRFRGGSEKPDLRRAA